MYETVERFRITFTEMRFEFPFNLINIRRWLFQQVNQGAYSNFGIQVGAKNKDFGAVS